MLVVQNITYIHPNKNLLFDNVGLTVNPNEKIALIGHNGSGKSTLLQLIAGELQPLDGRISVDAEPYLVPQIYGQYNYLTVAQALKVDRKLYALQQILSGDLSEDNYAMLEDDWTIEQRCEDALRHWQLTSLDLSQKMETLSGGQKTKVFLAGISIHRPELILLDEPSSHLDFLARRLLYDFIQTSHATLIVVSHDRKLLNLLNRVAELGKNGINMYGGNYDFYIEQKQVEMSSLNHDLDAKEKALRKARDKEREMLERQQKLDSRGKSKQEKAGVARIMMNTLRNNAENSTSKLKGVHSEKISDIKYELQELRSS
ncbi:MAG: ABC-F family ATP-binding cassette domain-containing protein, partial [Chryseobacterium sp.]